jgi:NAD(P)-dependent dehydrogenase (short-subunit alcohol dehydrogenase family)
MKQLAGKVAVITGGAGGIGFALAEDLGSEGMKLVLADVEQNALDEAVRKLDTKGRDAIGVRCDVSKFDQVEALAGRALERFGKIHVVCNNAGVSITGPIFEMSLDDWRWVYDVNIWGVIHGIKAFVPTLMSQGEEAHVINVASLASFNGTGDHAPYCSSKAAVLSLSQALYSEMLAFNTKIGVSVVCPGMVDTAINKSWRNRPRDDNPWSDREYNDDGYMQGSEKFQAAGVPPQDIARATLDALKQNRFYVFNGENWRDYIGRTLNPILRAENPPVLTWGPDLRPEEKKTVNALDQIP